MATLAWNSSNHLEAYFGVPCSERVLHTLNLRVSPEELAYMLKDADDRAVLVDPDLLPLLEQALDHVTAPSHLVVLGDHVPETSPRRRHRLRGPHRRRADALPAPRDRRAPGDGALLHLGDHRTPQGRRLHPPLDLPPCPGRHLPRRHVHRAGRRGAPPGSDVPRQRLGHALRGGRGRGQAGLLRRGARPVLLRRPPARRAGHRHRRGAHGVVGHRRRAGAAGARPFPTSATSSAAARNRLAP